MLESLTHLHNHVFDKIAADDLGLGLQRAKNGDVSFRSGSSECERWFVLAYTKLAKFTMFFARCDEFGAIGSRRESVARTREGCSRAASVMCLCKAKGESGSVWRHSLSGVGVEVWGALAAWETGKETAGGRVYGVRVRVTVPVFEVDLAVGGLGP